MYHCIGTISDHNIQDKSGLATQDLAQDYNMYLQWLGCQISCHDWTQDILYNRVDVI